MVKTMVVVLGSKISCNIEKQKNMMMSEEGKGKELHEWFKRDDRVGSDTSKGKSLGLLVSSNDTNATEGISFSFSESVDDSATSSRQSRAGSIAALQQDDERQDYRMEGQPRGDAIDNLAVSQASTISGSFQRKHPRNQDGFDDGIPTEIIVMNESSSSSSSSSCCSVVGNDVKEELDTVTKLQLAESMVASYKEALQSSEQVVKSIQRNLVEARKNEGRLYLERNSLLKTIRHLEDMECGVAKQITCIKIVLFLGLVFHLCFGSDLLLIVGASVYLFDDVLCKFV